MAARITPYEALLPQLDATIWPAIGAEAEQRGVDTRRRDRFVLLGTVGAVLRDLMPDDAPADAVDQYAELLYHAYHFWSFGRRLYVLTSGAFDRLASPEYSIGGWELAAPPACYVQFPAQVVWARVAPDAPFEPVDGCFIAVEDTAIATPAGAHLRALLVLGFRPERPGVSLVAHHTDLDSTAVAARADHPWREDAAPFANAIPGGERRGFHALTTTSELEAIVLRVLHELDRHSDRLHAREPRDEHGASTLPYIEVDDAA